MHAEYFAQININPKLQFCAKASFSLLLFLLDLDELLLSDVPVIVHVAHGEQALCPVHC